MEKKIDPLKTVHGELQSLVNIFYADSAMLGLFAGVTAEEIPEPQRSLLSHQHHMTVTLEKFHSSPVEVHVLQTQTRENRYAREILLRRQSDQSVVQYGIVRLNLDLLDDEVTSEIKQQQVPLGRILINHDVMRRVQLLSLYRVRTGATMAEAFEMGQGETCYGRTALIYCNDQPAVELLEIVTI